MTIIDAVHAIRNGYAKIVVRHGYPHTYLRIDRFGFLTFVKDGLAAAFVWEELVAEDWEVIE